MENKCFFFPARGALVHGEIEAPKFEHISETRTSYNINSVYGKGLISAYEKAESQNWAGTVLDKSVLKQINLFSPKLDTILEKLTLPYYIPYKNGTGKEIEYAFRLRDGNINNETFINNSKTIKENFESWNKGPLDPRTIEKLNNTIDFLKSVIDPKLL